MSSENHVKQFQSFSEASSFLWSIADLLRGTYKHHDFAKVILPFTVLRRLDCVLADSKEKVLEQHAKLKGGGVKDLAPILNRVTGAKFHNISKLDFSRLKDDPNHVAANVNSYVKGFSENVREIFIDRFKLPEQVAKLDEANILFLVVKRFSEVDLHPSVVDNHMMGSVFEDLIRRFAEQSNETAGEHFTPREVVRLMVNLLFMEDGDLLSKKGVVKTLYDPACGTGGMLSVAEDYLAEMNPDAHLEVFGQELNDETYAICKADMLLKAENPGNIARGNSFNQDGHTGSKFDYMLSNPPFGVEWKQVQKQVQDEHESMGFAGRFGAGLPRINDGSFLFLQHMISKMKPVSEGGSRLAIVFNGSPLFTGDAGSGESEIRRWVIENDWLEAIVALPDQLFFNTGISTYVWIVTNRKAKRRKGKVQLINAVEHFDKMRKSLGHKRKFVADGKIGEITELYGAFEEKEESKIFDNEDFGFSKITVERPLRLRFSVTAEKIEALKQHKAIVSLQKAKQKVKKGEEKVPNWGERLHKELTECFWPLVPPTVGTEEILMEGCVCGHPLKNHLEGIPKELDRDELFAPPKPGTPIENYLERIAAGICPCNCKSFKPRMRYVFKNVEDFEKGYSHWLAQGSHTLLFDYTADRLPAAVRKAVLSVFGESHEEGELCLDKKGNPEADSDLRDTENVPIKDDIQAYFEREVLPHVSDAWIDEDKTKVGYEIPLTRHFYKYQPLRPLSDIEGEILTLESEIQGMLKAVVA